MGVRQNLLLPNQDRWPTDQPIIELKNVTKRFGSKTVLLDLSLSIMTGKTTVIAGESGSGKSVLLRLMNGLTLPDEGEVFLFGQNLTTTTERIRTELRKRCTMVFQNYALIDSMTVAYNIGFPLRENTPLPPSEIRALVADLLEMLALSHAIDLMPASLSGGMKKRVALARAVITNPEIVLFDEPTTGLDPIMIEFVDELIRRTQREYELTSVIISHDMASNRRLADHIAILSRGCIVAEGDFEQILASSEPAVVDFMADVQLDRLGEGESIDKNADRSADLGDGEPTEQTPVVVIDDVHKSFGTNHVLKGISFTIPARQITVVIGGSGSGKSVLIKHIIGLFEPDQGVVHVFGHDLSTLSSRDMVGVQARIGMLFQGAALFDSMSVRENIAFPLVEGRKHAKAEIAAAVDDVATRLHVAHLLDRLPDSISNGEKKRVALARALITKPTIMIYDEPTTGQDPIMMKRVDDMIVEASQNFDITSIVISHDMRSTFRIADQIAMIKDGELVIVGTPAALKASDDPRVRAFIFAGSSQG
ncbi:MAG: ATP-binding cassette domain-containing protein [Myxococcota bacterium]|nr:ATP-binding cassette domain-containing protein [Myxococcota bacterium]